MAIVREQKKEGQNSGGTAAYNLAYDSSITAGSLLFCHVSSYLSSGTDITVTDNNSNTWTMLYEVNYDGSDYAWLGYVVNANSGATTVTIDSDESVADHYFGVMLIEVSGIDTTTPLTHNNATDTGGATWGSGNITTTDNDTYIVGTLALDNGNRTLTEDGSWTLVGEYQNGNNGMPYSVGERIMATTVTDEYSGTIAASSEYYSGIASFKAAAGGGPATGFMTTNTGYWGT